jgi:hypothetical protein
MPFQPTSFHAVVTVADVADCLLMKAAIHDVQAVEHFALSAMMPSSHP